MVNALYAGCLCLMLLTFIRRINFRPLKKYIYAQTNFTEHAYERWSNQLSNFADTTKYPDLLEYVHLTICTVGINSLLDVFG